MRHSVYRRREQIELPMELMIGNRVNSQALGLKRPSTESFSSSPKENLPKQPQYESTGLFPSTSNAYTRNGFRPSSSENQTIPLPAGCARTGQGSNLLYHLPPGFTSPAAYSRGPFQRFANLPGSNYLSDCLETDVRLKEPSGCSGNVVSAFSSASKAIDMTKKRSPKMDSSSLTERLNWLVNTWDSSRRPYMPPKPIDVSLVNRP